MKKLYFAFLIPILFVSCSKDIDFDMLDDLRFQPDFQLRLIRAKLSINDLVKKDSLFTVHGDNSVSIKYAQDDLFSLRALDFVDIPSQKEIEFKLSPLLSPFDLDMSLGTIAGVELGQTEIETGYIVYTLDAPTVFQTDVTVEVTFKNGFKNSNTLKKTLTLPMGSSTIKDSLNIDDSEFDFSASGVNHIGIKADILNAASVLPQTGLVDLKIQLSNINLKSAEGNFGTRTINLPNSNIDFDVEGLSEFTSGLTLTRPILKLITKNSIGVDLAINPDIDGVNDNGQISSLNAAGATVVGPSVKGNTKIDTITFDKDNSKIVEFLASLPTDILSSGTIEVNPGNPNAQNYIENDAEFGVGLEMELPLALKADNLTLLQKIEDLGFVTEKPEEIESVGLVFNSKNGFPFNVQLKISILDSMGVDSVDGFSLDLLSPAVVDNFGKVVSRTSKSEVYDFSEEMLNKLKKAKSMDIKAKLVTPNNGQDEVVIFTDYTLDLNIDVKVGLNLKAS